MDQETFGRALCGVRRPSHNLGGFGQIGLAIAALLLLAASAQGAGSNLVFNASWDSEGEPLTGWQIKYDQKGESWYFENHLHVFVLPLESGRRTVLRLAVPRQDIADNQGTKTDSRPIPVKPGGKYKLTAFARSTGPNCQLLMEGYRWKPGITPHPNPTLYELRKCYTFRQLFFGPVEGGTMGGPDKTWRRASMTVPEKVTGKLQKQKLDEIEFLVLHFNAIGGVVGDLYVDDVELERVN